MSFSITQTLAPTKFYDAYQIPVPTTATAVTMTVDVSRVVLTGTNGSAYYTVTIAGASAEQSSPVSFFYMGGDANAEALAALKTSFGA